MKILITEEVYVMEHTDLCLSHGISPTFYDRHVQPQFDALKASAGVVARGLRPVE